MSNEKRYGLTIVLLILWMMAFPYVMKMLGLAPAAKKPRAVAAGAVEPDKKGEPDRAKEKEPAGDAVAKGEEPAKKADAPAVGAAALDEARSRSGRGVGAGTRLGDRYLARRLSAPGAVDPERRRGRVALVVAL